MMRRSSHDLCIKREGGRCKPFARRGEAVSELLTEGDMLSRLRRVLTVISMATAVG